MSERRIECKLCLGSRDVLEQRCPGCWRKPTEDN